MEETPEKQQEKRPASDENLEPEELKFPGVDANPMLTDAEYKAMHDFINGMPRSDFKNEMNLEKLYLATLFACQQSVVSRAEIGTHQGFIDLHAQTLNALQTQLDTLTPGTTSATTLQTLVTQLQTDMANVKAHLGRLDSRVAAVAAAGGPSVSPALAVTNTLKVKPPPDYDGKKEVRNWLAVMEDHFRYHNTPVNKKVEMAVLHLEDKVAMNWRLKARRMADALAQARVAGTHPLPPDPTVWEDFKAELTKMYGPADPVAKARRQLETLRQGYGPVEVFHKKFVELASLITRLPLSEGDLIDKFSKGLNPEILDKCIVSHGSNDWASFDELASLAIEIDEGFKTAKSQHPGESSRKRKAQEVKTGKGKVAATTGLPPMSETEKKRLSVEGRCFICKEKGHRLFECPQRKGSASTQKKDDKKSSN